MTPYCFFSNRQLIFYVNINGQQRLVKFGERDTFGVSAFQTTNPYTAEAIRKSSLYKKGAIKEEIKVEEKPEPVIMGEVKKVPADLEAEPTPVDEDAVVNDTVIEGATSTDNNENVIDARNFTQAKSMLAKKLNIKYNDIKTPAQMMQLAKDAGITLKY